MSKDFQEEPPLPLRLLFAGVGGAVAGIALEGIHLEEVDSPDAFLLGLTKAERLGAPFAVALLPLGSQEWRFAALEALLNFPDLFFVYVAGAEGALSLGGKEDAARCVFLDEPVSLSVALPIMKHLAARWRAESARRRRDELERPALQNDARKLETLYNIVEKLHGERTFESGIAAALAEMAKFLGAKTASLMVLEPPANLRVVEALGPNRRRILGQTSPIENSRVAKYAIQSGQPILVTDMRDDTRFGESEEEMRYRSRSVLSVPILSKSGPLAVVNLGSDSAAPLFDERDRDLVVTLSRQIAIALEKDRLFSHLKTSVSGSIRALAGAIEAKDPYTRGHSDRVTHYSVLTALALGLGPDEVEVLKQASILHDIGKIGVPGEVLNKNSRLDDVEFRIIQRHPDIGINIVRQIGAMDQTLPIIRAHHERFDGLGYPNRLSGADIPLGARILAIADTFDAMTSNRPYRKGLSIEKAVEEIISCAGTQFDPDIAVLFAARVHAWPHNAEESVDFNSTL